MLPFPPFLQKWLFLNLLRLLTLVSCILVMTSTILILRDNFRHLPRSSTAANATAANSTLPTDYYASTDIPTQTWGILWSTLHHVYNLLALFLILLSEVSCSGWLERFFEAVLPFLGSEWGTQMMGALLILLGADTLSRKIGRFALIVNWLLVCVGLGNVLSGIAFHSRGKLLRSPTGFKRPVAEKLERLAEVKAKAEKVKDILLPVSVTPPPTMTQQRNESSETVVAAPTTLTAGLWSKVRGGATAEQAQEQHEKTPLRGGMREIPAAVPFRPGMPPPAAPCIPSITIPLSPPAAMQQPPTSLPLGTSPTRSASHHRMHSTDFLIINPSRSPSPPPLSCSSHRTHTSTPADATSTQYLYIAAPSSPSAASQRSPSVLASLRAAELEAKVKAKRRAEKKSLYLGSQRWLESRAGFMTGTGTGVETDRDGARTTMSGRVGLEWEDGERGLPPYRGPSRNGCRERARGGEESFDSHVVEDEDITSRRPLPTATTRRRSCDPSISSIDAESDAEERLVTPTPFLRRRHRRPRHGPGGDRRDLAESDVEPTVRSDDELRSSARRRRFNDGGSSGARTPCTDERIPLSDSEVMRQDGVVARRTTNRRSMTGKGGVKKKTYAFV